MLALGGGLAAAAAVGHGAGRAPGRLTPRDRACALHAEALDRLAVMDRDGATLLLESALAADSSYAPALLDAWGPLLGISPPHPRSVALARRIVEDSTHPLYVCARLALDDAPRWVGRGSTARSGCDRVARLFHPEGLSAQDQARLWRDLWADYPESVDLLGRGLAVMMDAGDWHGTLRLTSVAPASPSGLARLTTRGYRAVALHALGRHREALAEEALASDEARGKAGLETAWTGLLARELELDTVPLDSALAAHRDSIARLVDRSQLDPPRSPDQSWRLIQSLTRTERLLDLGDLTASLTGSAYATALADSLRDPWARAAAHRLRGRAAVKAGQPALAERSLLAARANADSAEWPWLLLEVEHNLLHLYEGLGRWDDAIRAGHRYIALTERRPLAPARMMSHRDLAWLLRRRGRWEEAQRHFAAMLAIIDSLGPGNTEPLFFAGEYYESMGNLARAAASYASEALRASGLRSLEALARVAELMADTTGALEAAARFDQLRLSYPEKRPLLPGVLARMGRHAEAAAALEAARRAAAAKAQVAGWARLSAELADVEYQRSLFARAAALGESTATAARRVGERDLAIRAAAIAAAASLRITPAPGAGGRGRLATLQREARGMRAPALERDVAVLRGDALAALGDLPGALQAYRTAQDLADAIGRSLEHDPARAGFRAAHVAPSNRALALIAAARNDPRAARWWVEWSLRRKGAELAPPATRQTLADLRVRASDLAIVDYVILDTAVAALVLTDAGESIVILPQTTSQLAAALAQLYAGVSPRIGSAVDGSRARLDVDALGRLASGLLAPLEGLLGGRRELVIVPDAWLSLVPFDALPLDERGRWSSLAAMDRHTIRLAPALGEARTPAPALPLGPVLVVVAEGGNAVPGAQRELAALRGAVDKRAVRVLAGDSASEARLGEAAPAASILHFIAHARPNHHSPDLAELLLTPDSLHDGRLQAAEIRRLRLDQALVVLSACETAAGRVLLGEGPMSLSRAFLQAGAAEVVATLWPVGDGAADLMEEFYRKVESGLTPAEALRAAKVRLRDHGASPLVWASFSLLGRLCSRGRARRSFGVPPATDPRAAEGSSKGADPAYQCGVTVGQPATLRAVR